jgi:DNA-binding transcriptional LysR family regulator
MVNLYHLQYFCLAFKHQSLTKAAELGHVSVPTVSHAIKSLEATLNQKLLGHKKNSLEFTAEAEELYAKANDLLRSAEELKTLTGKSAAIRIASSNSLFEHFLVNRFKKNLMEFDKIELKIANSRRMRQLFQDREIDFGIAIPDRYLLDIPMTSLYEGKFVLAESKHVKNPDFYIIGDQGEEVDIFYDRYKKIHKKLPEKICVVESWSGAFKLMREGMGRALLPDFMVKGDKDFRIVDQEIKLPEYKVGLFQQGTRHPEFKAKLKRP